MAFADPVIEQLYHACTAWEWAVKHIYETHDGQFQHINIPVPLDNTYLVVIVDKPKREILGHYILNLHPYSALSSTEDSGNFSCFLGKRTA